MLLLSFPSTPFPSYLSTSAIQDALFGADPSLAGFIASASYGRTTVTGKIVGPLSIPSDYALGDLDGVEAAAIRAADPLIDLREYNRIVLMGPTKIFAGYPEAIVGCLALDSPSYGPFNGSFIFMPAEESTNRTYLYQSMSHELGHNLGAMHANSSDYGADPLGPPGVAGLSTEYGDPYSVMGRLNEGHFAAPHKYQFGWLDLGTGIRTVSATGNFVLQPYGSGAGGLKALKVKRGSSGTSYLWIEYRQPTDQYEALLGSTSQTIYSGAFIHFDDGSGSIATQSLSFQPNSTPDKFVTVVLAAGSSWSDPYSDLAIQVNAATSAGLPIVVSYGNSSGCATAINPSTAQLAAAGGTASATVTAPSGCAWTAASNAAWLTLTGTSSGTGNGSINYNVAANPLSVPRFGRIAAGGMSLGVIQAEAAGTIAAISAQSASFPATGGQGQIGITTSTPDYAWPLPFDYGWVQITAGQWKGTGTATYVVGENTGAARSVTIPIGPFNFVVSQAAGTPASSQLNWEQVDATGATPAPRYSDAMAYFPATGETIVYGGMQNATQFSDTWAWNGTGWLQKSPAHNPGQRVAHVMVYDSVRGEIVMFGGASITAGSQLNDTWVWNGTDWIQRSPVHSPPIRANAAAAFDAVSKQVVLFGGTNVTGSLNDTWVWDGSDWTQKFPLASPPVRDSHSMAYDPVRHETVMFGGAEPPQAGNPSGTWYQDTWTWDGSNWHLKSLVASPLFRHGQGMVYDPDLGRVLMYGGSSTLTPQTAYSQEYFPVDTWTWNGVAWAQLFPQTIPGGAWNYRMVWDDTRKQLVMYVADDLTCKNRGPKTWVAAPGDGVISATPNAIGVPAAGGSATITIQGSAAWSATTTDSWISISSGQGTGARNLSFAAAANPWGLGRTGTILVGGLAIPVAQDAAAAGAPQIADGGALNAADGRAAFSPGIFMSIYGGGFADAISQAPGAPLPVTLAGTSVEIVDNGSVVNAPLFFVAPGQINAQMPFNVVGPELQVRVRTARGVSDPVTIGLLVSSPKLFTKTMNGLGEAIAVHANYSLISAANPAHSGEIIVVYLTGLGAVSPTLPAGAGGGDGSPGNPLNLVTTMPQATVGGYPAAVTWAGMAPYYPGLYQLNVQLSTALLPAMAPIVVQGGATPSQSGVYIMTAH